MYPHDSSNSLEEAAGIFTSIPSSKSVDRRQRETELEAACEMSVLTLRRLEASICYGSK